MVKSQGETRREGYEVGVFKNGQIKKILRLKDSPGYIREKLAKQKSRKPKRECSSAQLAALERGRAIRSAQRRDGSGSVGAPRHRPPRPRAGESHRYGEKKVRNLSKKSEKRRMRREKEKDRGGRGGGRKSDEYTSGDDDDHVAGVSGDSSC